MRPHRVRKSHLELEVRSNNYILVIKMFASGSGGAGGDGQDPWKNMKKMQEADKVRLKHLTKNTDFWLASIQCILLFTTCQIFTLCL